MSWDGTCYLYCPFCEKQTIVAFNRPAYKTFGHSRGSGKSSTYSIRSEEEFKILSGCKNCGKSEKEVRDKMGFK